MTTARYWTGYRVVNEAHGFRRTTTCPRRIRRMVAESKPAGCGSETTITRVVNGQVVARVELLAIGFHFLPPAESHQTTQDERSARTR